MKAWRDARESGLARLRELVERVTKGFARHDTGVFAMALAYRGLFALLPFAALLVAMLSFLRADTVLVWLSEQGPSELRVRLPELISWLEDGVLGQTRGVLLAGAIALAFWSVARGASMLTRALNSVFEVEETRPAWKRIAASVTVAPALAFAMIAALTLLLVTSGVMAWISSWVGLDEVFVFLWSLLRVPVGLLLLALVVSVVYRFAPGERLALRSVAPGAVLAVALWALATAAFAFALAYLPDYGTVYGSLGAAISLLLYLYVSATALLLGAEVNAATRWSTDRTPVRPSPGRRTGSSTSRSNSPATPSPRSPQAPLPNGETRKRRTHVSEAASAQVTAGDHETHLNRAGEGNAEAVLFLHGSGPGASAWSNWQFALPALGGRFDCLAPDLVGYGQSEHPEEPPADAGEWLEAWLGQLSGLLDTLGVEKVHLVGNSMGGALALHLADRYPERGGRVALMGSMGVPFKITDELDALWGFYDDPSSERMTEVINWFVYDPATVGGDVEAIARDRYGGATKPEISRSFAAMFPGPDRQRHVDALALSDEAIGRIENPTLLVHGRDDVIIPLETSLSLLQNLQRPQMHVFGRCRHWIMIEHRKSFNLLLESFLAGEV